MSATPLGMRHGDQCRHSEFLSPAAHKYAFFQLEDVPNGPLRFAFPQCHEDDAKGEFVLPLGDVDKLLCVAFQLEGLGGLAESLDNIVACSRAFPGNVQGAFQGGIPLDLPSNTSLPGEKGGPFILEGDEYPAANFDMRSKFLFYRPSWAVVTSLQWDHINVFPTPADYRATFERFVALVPREGYLLLGEHVVGDGAWPSFRSHIVCDYETYGVGESMDWSFTRRDGRKGTQENPPGPKGPPRPTGRGALVDVFHRGRLFLSFRSRSIGLHNVENAVAAIALAHRAGIPAPVISAAIESHRGVKRRQEVIAEVRGILFIDDLAHHPSKVRATLAAIRETFPERRIWAVFEPSTYSTRNRRFLPRYRDAFTEADRVVLMPVPNPEQIAADERITTLDFERAIEASRTDVLDRQEDLPGFLTARLRSGDIALFMSSGALGKHIPRVIRAVSGE